jgi:hypothetical protein
MGRRLDNIGFKQADANPLTFSPFSAVIEQNIPVFASKGS